MIEISPHLPLGRQQSLPSGRLQPASVPTSATRWQIPEVKEATTLFSTKRTPHQKPIKMKRQRTISQIREKEKTSEKQLSDLEIINFHERNFRLMMLKMMQDIGNKLEAKM